MYYEWLNRKLFFGCNYSIYFLVEITLLDLQVMVYIYDMFY